MRTGPSSKDRRAIIPDSTETVLPSPISSARISPCVGGSWGVAPLLSCPSNGHELGTPATARAAAGWWGSSVNTDFCARRKACSLTSGFGVSAWTPEEPSSNVLAEALAAWLWVDGHWAVAWLGAWLPVPSVLGGAAGDWHVSSAGWQVLQELMADLTSEWTAVTLVSGFLWARASLRPSVVKG